MFRVVPTMIVACTILLWSNALSAQETTLKAINPFPRKILNSRVFEQFIELINKDGKGRLRIDYLYGPTSVPPFEVGNALKAGVFDIANVPGAFYANLLPEADAWKLAQLPIAELRRNGGFDYLAKLYEEKMNVVLLARQIGHTPVHLYLTKPVSNANLSGLKIRTTPNYRDFVESLGATIVSPAPGEVYTALEAGVVDGYSWPIVGIDTLTLVGYPWHEKIRYRLEPGFYVTDISFLISKAAWSKLDADQRKLISDAALQIEARSAAFEAATQKTEIERQRQAGIEVIELKGADRDAYLTKAYTSGWARLVERSPQHGATLKVLFSKPE